MAAHPIPAPVTAVKPLMDIDRSLENWLKWLEDQSRKVVGAYLQKGGWEGWAQVELGYFLATSNPSWTVEREVEVYTAGKRADFRCTAPGGGGVAIVELKVESLFQSGNAAADFITRVDADRAKLSGLKPEYAGARVIVMGISVAGETSAAAEDHWRRNLKMFAVYAKDVWKVNAFCFVT